MEKTDRLLHQNILKVFLGYLLPTVMGMITHSLYCLADVMFIGVYVGSTALAAMNICMPIFTLFTSIGLLIGVGASTTIMVKLGQGDHESPDKIFSLAILCNLVVGVTISVLATLYLEPFARFLGATDQLMPYVFPIYDPHQLHLLRLYPLQHDAGDHPGGLQPQIGDDCHCHWQSV